MPLSLSLSLSPRARWSCLKLDLPRRCPPLRGRARRPALPLSLPSPWGLCRPAVMSEPRPAPQVSPSQGEPPCPAPWGDLCPWPVPWGDLCPWP